MYMHKSLKHFVTPYVLIWGLVNYDYSDSARDWSIVHNYLLPPHFCHINCGASRRGSRCPCPILILGPVICFRLKKCDFVPAHKFSGMLINWLSRNKF